MCSSRRTAARCCRSCRGASPRPCLIDWSARRGVADSRSEWTTQKEPAAYFQGGPVADEASNSNPHPFDVRTIKYLVALMSRHDLSEIDLREGELRIRLLRGPRGTVVTTTPAAIPAVAASPAPALVPAAAAEPSRPAKAL